MLSNKSLKSLYTANTEKWVAVFSVNFSCYWRYSNVTWSIVSTLWRVRKYRLLCFMRLVIRWAQIPFTSTFPVRLYWTLLGYRNIRNFRSRHRSGRPRVTSHVDKMMKRLCLENPHITAFKIQAEIALPVVECLLWTPLSADYEISTNWLLAGQR